MKDGTTHGCPTSPSTPVVWTPARWWPRSCTRPTRADTTTLPKTLAAALRQTSRRRWMWRRSAEALIRSRMCRPIRPPLTPVGLEGVRRQPPGRAGSPSPSRRVLRAGTEMMRLNDGRSPTPDRMQPSGVSREAFKLRAEIVERLCPQPRSRRYAPDLASGPRERAQAIPASRRRPQPIVADAPTHRRTAPRRRPWRIGIGVLVRACYARWSRPGRSDRPHRLGGWRTRLRRDMRRRGVKSRSMSLFQRAVKVLNRIC